jgi:hypothetical protein
LRSYRLRTALRGPRDRHQPLDNLRQDHPAPQLPDIRAAPRQILQPLDNPVAPHQVLPLPDSPVVVHLARQGHPRLGNQAAGHPALPLLGSREAVPLVLQLLDIPEVARRARQLLDIPVVAHPVPRVRQPLDSLVVVRPVRHQLRDNPRPDLRRPDTPEVARQLQGVPLGLEVHPPQVLRTEHLEPGPLDPDQRASLKLGHWPGPVWASEALQRQQMIPTTRPR